MHAKYWIYADEVEDISIEQNGAGATTEVDDPRILCLISILDKITDETLYPCKPSIQIVILNFNMINGCN